MRHAVRKSSSVSIDSPFRPMKISIAISALILATAAGLGWQIEGRIAAARADERKLATEAAQFGISVGDTHSSRSAKRVRIDREAEARLLAIESVQLTKESENGGKRDEASQARNRDWYARVSALDASSSKILIAALLSSRELEEKKRAEQVVYLLRVTLAGKDPRGALAFVMEHSAALKNADGIEYVISDSLGNWAKDDPLAAVEWMKKNAAAFPAAMKVQARHNVVHSAAEKDPRLAFTLIAELGLNESDSGSEMCTIVIAATTDEERNATLAALREYREAHKDDKTTRQAADRVVGYFAWGFKEDGFDAGSKWLASANLTPKELDRFCGELTLNYDGDEHAQWIEWIGGHTPPGKGDQQIINLIGRWTERDYEDAGKWLAAAAEGPAKNAAIRGFALTIFKHDPETAMQWIMTLPPDERREKTLQFILVSKLRDDPEAAAAFAKEHGIK
jgi:hypothetical protein